MKPSVYIETSVVSAAEDLRDDPISKYQRIITLGWFARQAPHFELFYSEAVTIELEAADFPGRGGTLARVKKMTILAVTPEVQGVAEIYRQQFVMPREAVGDALHLAAACVHKMDYLLTWNCRHIANANKIRHIEVINRRMSLLTPVLLTPEMLLAEGQE